MRNWKAFAFAALASTLLAGSLQAQSGTGHFWWRGVNGATSYFNPTQAGGSGTHNVYTPPYKASFAVYTNTAPQAWMLPPSGGALGPTQDIFCVDFFYNAKTSSAGYDVNFTNLGDAASAVTSGLGLTHHASLNDWLKAAYLSEKIRVLNNPSSTDVAYLNGAIWQIMAGGSYSFYRSPTGLSGSWNHTAIQTFVTDANANFNSVNRQEWVVASDVDRTSGGSQNFLVHVTPEPATLLLLGTGLLATLVAAGALRRSAV